MKTQFKLAALALLLSTLNSQHSTAFAQGSLTPPGSPAPTMKSLDQIEARTPISSAPYTISQAGSYYLTTNVATAVSNAIVIAASGVTLDLNGFTISSTVADAANGGTAILLYSGLSDITIANGHIRGGVTNNGSGVYSGSGFANGIYYSINGPVNVLVSRVSVSGCLDDGISLSSGDSTVVESCTVRTVGSAGIIASTVKQSSALDCGISAILGGQVSDCNGQTSSYGYGVLAATAVNCNGSSGSGDGVYAATAQNCYGYSTSGSGVRAYNTALNCSGSSGSGYGVFANTAQNCYGYSTNQYGVNAYIALNCYGYSTSGLGVVATIAQNCYGYGGNNGVYANTAALNCYGYSGGNGDGVHADIAQNCYGSSGVDGNGVFAYNAQNCYGYSGGNGDGVAAIIANGCYGYSSSGTGVSALIASLCHGDTSTGTALSTSHNVNSY